MERHRMGGDCLNTGCVPSKSMIRASRMVAEARRASAELGLGTILNVIHPYPTQAEGIKRAAGAYTRARVTPFVRKILDRWMALRR